MRLAALLTAVASCTAYHFTDRPAILRAEIEFQLKECEEETAYILLLHNNKKWPQWFDHMSNFKMFQLGLRKEVHDAICGWSYSADPEVHAAFNLTDGAHEPHDDAPSGSHHLPALFLCARSAANGGLGVPVGSLTRNCASY